MKLLAYNELRNATITPSSVNELFPADNLFDKRRVKQFRFTGFTSENVVVFQSGLSFDSVIIDSHNLTSSATVKIQANATDVWTSPSVDITLTVRETIAYLWDSVQTYDYVRVLVEDPTNTEPVYIGMFYLSTSNEYKIVPGWTETRQLYGRARYRIVTGSFFPMESSDYDNIQGQLDLVEGTIQLSQTRQQLGTAWPIYAIIDPDDLAFLPVYSILADSIDLSRTKSLPEIWDGTFEFQEVN